MTKKYQSFRRLSLLFPKDYWWANPETLFTKQTPWICPWCLKKQIKQNALWDQVLYKDLMTACLCCVIWSITTCNMIQWYTLHSWYKLIISHSVWMKINQNTQQDNPCSGICYKMVSYHSLTGFDHLNSSLQHHYNHQPIWTMNIYKFCILAQAAALQPVKRYTEDWQWC